MFGRDLINKVKKGDTMNDDRGEIEKHTADLVGMFLVLFAGEQGYVRTRV